MKLKVYCFVVILVHHVAGDAGLPEEANIWRMGLGKQWGNRVYYDRPRTKAKWHYKKRTTLNTNNNCK